ncbi:probable glutamate receptor isoform X1 [Apus apus]|uniref:probable glutamate receptor isoform X1 n=2 Tax=Apus apus TaxID=8895 RepID=UPI0021F913C0|nr:probable glutamate receptor isoform X1 [Apus apus]XP_051493025.1 probable glutamate receptor isoform X1 [Apus apus]XP_051493026.1 probable glutamate receptor isoform X1 [Apus apus]XP_051493027.1 probable glutamate receptor isoform X1 [Apus apus]XP_051493028.1 probable glutamate receptor isoform X1 [Apus apus]
MDQGLGFMFCVITALLFLRESSQTGARRTGDAVGKNIDSRGPEEGLPTLTVTTIPEDPYVMVRNAELEGYCIDLLKALSGMLHFSYRVKVVGDGKYGAVSASGNWTGMIGEILRKEADIAVAPLTVTSEREEVVSFTTPFLQTGIGILLRKDTISQELSFFHFLAPFSKEIWTGLLFAYVLTCFCLFLVARLSPCEWNEPKNEENHFTFLNSLWFGAGALALQGVTPQPKALSVRVIAAIWWLFTIALLAAYIANFTALLSSGTEQLPIQTFEDLVKQRKIEFGTLEGSSTFYYFKNSKNPIHQMIYEYMDKRRDHVLVKTYQEAVQRVMESDYAFIGESISQDLAAARHCNLIRAPEVIGARGFGIAATQASPWIKQLSVAILKLRESGDLDYLRNKWWESSCLHRSRDRWSPLQPQALGGLFLTLAIGLALGVIAALVELSSKSRHAAAHAKKSCCSVFTEEMCTRLRIKENTRQSQETSGRANP